ncbi:beta-glucosidase [candidate division KSB1 bacterium]|nr:beta-glucosidase [candidate division KSB1 bacterium]
MVTEILKFPSEFIWGAATAAYQIEGGWNCDGKGESIWDRFCRVPGNILEGHTGDVACDHYHRFLDDIKLMKNMGLKAYRFSIAWSRIFPNGKGLINLKGIDFYNRLVDALLLENIQPFITLYHWDLPQTLQHNGGWANRDTAFYFQEYAAEVSRRLGDRVNHWMTHNEPAVTAYLGHLDGIHAPGLKDFKTAVQVAHHLLLSHGLSVPVIRENIKPQPGEIGIALNLSPSYPATDAPEDSEAARRYFNFNHGWFLEPLSLGRYPESIWKIYEKHGYLPAMQPDDLKIIATPTDFLGVNFYFRDLVKNAPGKNILNYDFVKLPNAQFTEMGWEVFPEGLYVLLLQLYQDYKVPRLHITENGAAFHDEKSPDGKIHDVLRIKYLQQHFQQAHRAIQAGVPLAGYFVWSLMDNFEWSFGFSKRFGLIYTDYQTLERTLKDSAIWYRQVIEQNGIQVK